MTAHVAQRLRDAAAALPVGPVSLLKLAEAHGPSAQGSLLLLLAAPCLLPVPGVGTVLGLGMIALALAMWRGDDMLGLPGRVAQVQMSHLWAQRVVGMVFRDGVATLLGFATAGLALLLTVGMASMVLFWAVPWVLS